jgi:hypothetical protein
MPDQLAEADSGIYCQVRTYHYLKHVLPPTSALLRESGWATTLYAAHRDRAGPYAAVAAAAAQATAAEAAGSADAPAAAANAATLTEVASVLYGAVRSVAAGTKHCPDYGPLLPCEYEVTVPKVDNSLYLNIAEGAQGGVRVDTFRPLPDGSEAPVAADGRVRKGHIITAINGLSCEGIPFEQAIQHLREAPSYVTLRLTADIGERNKLKQQQAVLDADKEAEEARERAAAGAKDPAWPPAGLPAAVVAAATAAADSSVSTGTAAAVLQRPSDPVSDSDSEDDYDLMPEEGLRGLMRTMAPKRRLLLAASEAAEPPEDALWQDDIFGVLAHAHAAAAAAAAGASQQRSRALRKPVDQFDPATGLLVQRWDSLTSASKGLSIPICSISNCMRGQAEHAGGFVFRAAAVEPGSSSTFAQGSALPLVNMQGLPAGAARLMALTYGAGALQLPRDDDTDVVVVSSSSSAKSVIVSTLAAARAASVCSC